MENIQLNPNIHELLLVEIMRTTHLLNQPIGNLLEEFEITQSQYNILRILRGAYPDHLNAGVMKNRMVNPKSDATRLTDRLVAKNLVVRKIQKDNKRQMNVSITKKGLALLEKIEPTLSGFLNHYENSLTENAKIEEFMQYLANIREQTKVYLEKGNA